MVASDLNDLVAFIAVARVRSFTRAAAQLGVSQSALSHTIRGLETRLGIRLLTRTTRSVSPTEAGERLLQTVAPRLEEVEAELANLSGLRDKPAGLIRITSAEHAADSVLWPRLPKFIQEHPDIKVEVNVDYGMTDIVAQRYHAGVRLGDQVEKDMVAVRIGPDLRIAVVGAPSYFANRPPPRTPQDLSTHNCINLRLPTHDSFLAWEFENKGHVLRAHVQGQLAFNMGSHILRAALAGCGVAYLPEDMVEPHVAAGLLVPVLREWCEPFSGYHLYFPSRRQTSPAFSLLVETLRHEAPSGLIAADTALG
jgi:DNA-binding transcriptional LysR family regulator